MKPPTNTGLKYKNGRPIKKGDVLYDVQDTENGEQQYVRVVIWVHDWAGFGLWNRGNNTISRIGDDVNHKFFIQSALNKTNYILAQD